MWKILKVYLFYFMLRWVSQAVIKWLQAKTFFNNNQQQLLLLYNFFSDAAFQVMKLFEQFDAPEFVIRAAHIALNMALPDDPNIVSIVE